MNRTEARIVEKNNVLLLLSPFNEDTEFSKWTESFLGKVLHFSTRLPSLAGKTVFMCGDLNKAASVSLKDAARVFAIRELCENEPAEATWTYIGQGRVPVSIHGLGIFYPQFFDPADDHFNRICSEHVFQNLTESTKPAKANRTGIYLTPVEKEGEKLHFRLLRCSTNLSGPTDNFRSTDTKIVKALNDEAESVFESHFAMNHVLAQVYHNRAATENKKQSKAKIRSHADKTKDMPENGIMAFCTFYDQLEKLKPLTDDRYDYGYKNKSGMTRLFFRIKKRTPDRSLPSSFSLTLYPGSVFLMPLSTNRLYTHETRPSMLNAEHLPTRLGYVVRCSSTEAVHSDGQTYLKLDGQNVIMSQPTEEGMVELRGLYAEENKSESFIDYGDRFKFSMNSGDYLAPEI